MKYFKELKKSMEYLAKNRKSIFLGQAVQVPGTAMRNTLKDINKKKLIELPVAEEMQMGMTIGMMMKGYIPISIYPRWNFLLLSINQLINHLDKFNEMTNNYYKSKAIIRTSIGSQRPLNPQSQHVGDFTIPIKMMAKNLEIVKLKKPQDIFTSYKKAIDRKDNISTILVEYGDFYNEK
jgi:pyruvate/2-oxoglutarate/acetoin dehydrogenase E1 component